MASEVHKLKDKAVNDLATGISNSKTLMIVSIRGLPSKQFQEIKKSIRKHASIKVVKKNIILRAIKELKKESILGLEKYINENCAFVLSDTEGYELAGILSQKKTPVFAKAGQIAPEDIEVKKGPTELVPGPAISELGALGIQITVEDGKISIKHNKVVVKEGNEIHEGAASILQKLNIQPFSVGLKPTAIYDVQEEKIYTDIKINSEETKSELINAASKALGFAQKIAYYCKDTIGYLLAKANMNGEAISKLSPNESSEEKAEEEKKEKVVKEEKAEENPKKLEEKENE